MANRPRIIFGVFSAENSAGAVNQLAQALQPHRVLVHHDFSKRGQFSLRATNASLVPDPINTGWGTWGFAEAIFHTLAHALDTTDFDYFQMLSPSCLPIRPLRELEQRIAEGRHDIHADMLPVERDDDTLMSFGYRTYVPGSTLRMRLLRRARGIYLGPDSEMTQTSSVTTFSPARHGHASPMSSAALMLTRMAAAGWLGKHPFGHTFRPMIGGTWLGMTKPAVQYLVKMRNESQVVTYLKELPLVDEILLGSLLANSGLRIGSSNHVINEFSRDGHPRWIEAPDLDRLFASGRFFARKFRDDPACPQRRRALARAAAGSGFNGDFEARIPADRAV